MLSIYVIASINVHFILFVNILKSIAKNPDRIPLLTATRIDAPSPLPSKEDTGQEENSRYFQCYKDLSDADLRFEYTVY